MDINTTYSRYNKVSEPKTIDTINVNGRYVDSDAFKSKIVTIAASSAFLAAFATFVALLFM